jgi:hypothetical protein
MMVSHRRIALAAWLGLAMATTAIADEPVANASPNRLLPGAKPVPDVQVEPWPGSQAAFTISARETTRYHFGPDLRRPFLYPIVGPGHRSLTRMGHPHDPEGHSHHNSVWVAHNNVNGDDFWSDKGPGRVVHKRIVRYDDSDDEASLIAINAWVGKGDKVHMTERRKVTVRPLGGKDENWLLTLDLQFETPGEPVTLGATPFGMVGVRMAKSIGVNDGGGLIRNSEGNVNEQGPNGVYRKRARWVDYSGLIRNDEAAGITLLDHPANPNHPSHFHVRNDGWMGASLTLEQPITIEPGQLLRLRYGLFIHGGLPNPRDIEARWGEFARTRVEDLPTK